MSRYIRKGKQACVFAILFTILNLILNILIVDANQLLSNYQTIIMALIPSLVALIAVYLAGLSILLPSIISEEVRKLKPSDNQNLQAVINIFVDASKIAVILIVYSLFVYFLILIPVQLSYFIYLIVNSIVFFIAIYLLFLLLQITTYMLKLLIDFYNIINDLKDTK